jgi:hypothetical protein
MEDESPFTRIAQGFQSYDEMTNALNLPMVNARLAYACQKVDGTGILTRKQLIRNLKLLGVCVTSPATSSLKYTRGGPDIRVFTLVGDVDIHEMFRTGLTKGGYAKPARMSDRLCFYVIPQKVEYPPGATSVTLKWYINGSDYLQCSYTKGYVWKVIPVVKPMGEPICYVHEGLQVFDVHTCPDESGKKLEPKLFDLRGLVFRLGHMKKNRAKGNPRQLEVKGDAATDAREIQKAIVHECHVDWLAPVTYAS